MAKTLSDIQTAVRIYARDGALTLTSGDGLVSVNRLYRQLAGSLPWPEVRRKDTTLSTTASTAAYTWPSYPTSFRFIDIKTIEIQDDDDSDKYKIIYAPPDEWTWNEAGNKPDQVIPDHYMRVASGVADQVEFRPSPKIGSKTIRITGLIEPTPFVYAGNKSFFISQLADDAFEYMIAASWLSRDGFAQESQSVLAKSISLLKMLFEIDESTEELLKRVATE